MKKKLIWLAVILLVVAVGYGIWERWFAGPVIPADSLATLSDEKKAPTTTYTQADLQKHATAADCWLAISGTVYDVSAFIPTHPGILSVPQACGNDNTAAFSQTPEKEAQAAKKELDASYRIGVFAQ